MLRGATGKSKRDSSTARADAFAGSEREERASARSGRNDRLGFEAMERLGQGSVVLWIDVGGVEFEFESKPAPFQRRKGCGTQMPVRGW